MSNNVRVITSRYNVTNIYIYVYIYVYIFCPCIVSVCFLVVLTVNGDFSTSGHELSCTSAA